MDLSAISETDQARILYWQKWIIVFAIVCELFLAADWYGFAAVIPFLSQDLSLDPAQAGLAQGVFALTYGVGMVVWSPISRRMSARAMLMIGLAGTGLGMVLQVYVQNYEQLIVLRLLIGFFDAAIWTGNIKLIIGWFPQSKRGAMMGLILAAYSLAITLDFAIGIPLTAAFGWRSFFAILAGGTLIIAVIDWLFARNGPADIGIAGFTWGENKRDHHGSSVSIIDIFRSRWIIVGGLGIAACTFALSATATWVIPAYITVQKMPVESAALVGTLMGLSQVVVLVIGGYMADRFSKTLIIKIGTALALFSALTFVAAATYPMSFGLLLIPAALSGIAVLGGGAIFSLLSEKYPDEIAPAAVGYAELSGVLATFAGPALLGFVIKTTGSFSDAFIAFAVVEGVLLVILVALTRSAATKAAGVPLASGSGI
jgi:MFS family permease